MKTKLIFQAILATLVSGFSVSHAHADSNALLDSETQITRPSICYIDPMLCKDLPKRKDDGDKDNK